ncbi:hypothetical protein PHYBLDRAFT_165817 [Phycomyces blakesleeanus NRRL 1555(-)]|uniref:Uncharacterized protein n=2 Tax=Phycomyces blakesleeanus TaxID=4837 RepID=A0A162PTH1_PHYB8|nr:hypothetical protein PHYBLDRAFT_165817 [Phycomyces blakesleeanus NRRL 1555(-)]OAD75837.1 hypothetical protein PHYBLDRAFT_165817 [Phycomyces blakesleeanus NRRL 1555(-)]|eukprot:XP_018293877.1 hypothetical protein PHYBLDRAFT_165817 [Phycomyces blakesleeanus NRRL 1555(-)]
MHPLPLNTSFQSCLPSPPTSPDGRNSSSTLTLSISTKRSHSSLDTTTNNDRDYKDIRTSSSVEPKTKHPRFGLSLLESYLEHGGSPNVRGTQHALSMLCWACHSRSVVALRVLLDHKELDPGFAHGTADRATALHIAASIGFTQGVKLLLEHPKVIQDTLDINGQTALHKAVISNHPTILKLLLDNGSRLDLKDNNGRLPLHLAVLHRSIACLSLLLNYQYRTVNNPTNLDTLWTTTSPTTRSNLLNSRTVVQEAIVTNQPTLLLRIFQDKAWRAGSPIKQHLVMEAVMWNRISCLDVLITVGGCDINCAPSSTLLSPTAHSDSLDTPLYRAVQQRKLDIVQRLRQAGADPCDQFGHNQSFIYAAIHGFVDMAALLITPRTSRDSISQALLMSESAGCRARLQSIIDGSGCQKNPN